MDVKEHVLSHTYSLVRPLHNGSLSYQPPQSGLIGVLIPEESPLRHPPAELSRRQVYILDGIRFAAEMAHIAYERLSTLLQGVASSSHEPSTRDIATAMLDAWSIVDSAHHFRD